MITLFEHPHFLMFLLVILAECVLTDWHAFIYDRKIERDENFQRIEKKEAAYEKKKKIYTTGYIGSRIAGGQQCHHQFIFWRCNLFTRWIQIQPKQPGENGFFESLSPDHGRS